MNQTMYGFDKLSPSQTFTHPEFGRRISTHSLSGKTIGAYYVLEDLIYHVYQNEDGFTVNAPRFPGAFGFGDTESEAFEEWTECLCHLRESYGSLQASEGTKGAVELRDALMAVLVLESN